MHTSSPTVVRLDVHLPGEERVVFDVCSFTVSTLYVGYFYGDAF